MNVGTSIAVVTMTVVIMQVRQCCSFPNYMAPAILYGRKQWEEQKIPIVKDIP